MENKQTVRKISEIAKEIKKSWKKVTDSSANPYLMAMLTMDKITDNYGYDPGTEIVNYFLANAQGWRGEDARRIKKELNDMVKSV